MHKLAWPLASVLVVTACGGIGDGSAPESMELRIGGVSENAEVFECLAGSAQARLTFTDGRVGDFARRSQWTSSDESVLRVSNGDIESDEGTFVSGALLPLKAGMATVTVNYLDRFEDSIDVTVSPTRIEVTPAAQTIAQGTSLQMRATGVLEGTTETRVASLNGLGRWSVEPVDGAEPVSEIAASNGVLRASESVAGRDRARFRVDFCDREQSVEVAVVNQTIESLVLGHESDPRTPVEQVVLPPDASTGLRAIARFSGGLTQDITGGVSINFADEGVGFSGLRGIGVVTSNFNAIGQETTIMARLDPDRDVEGDEIFSEPVAFRVLDVALEPDSFVITPDAATVLPDSGVQFAVTASFTGPDGSVTQDLTRDVLWSSSEQGRVSISNVNGQRGFALTSAQNFGAATIGAARLSDDAPAVAPATTLTNGSVDGEDNVTLLALTVGPDPAVLSAGDSLRMTATGQLENSSFSGEQDLTTSVVWSVSDPSLASIGNDSGARGVLRALTDEANRVVTVTAEFFDQRIQENRVTATREVTLNPQEPEEGEGE